MLTKQESDLIRDAARKLYPAARDVERMAAVALVADELASHYKRITLGNLPMSVRLVAPKVLQHAVDVAYGAVNRMEDNF